MERFGKLVRYTIVGLIVSGAAYSVLVYKLVDRISAVSGPDPESRLSVTFLVLLPFGLLLGSTVTGYLSQPLLPGMWHLAFVSPGFYFAAVFGVTNVLFGGISFSSVLLFTLSLWFVASFVGAASGYFIRLRRTPTPPTV